VLNQQIQQQKAMSNKYDILLIPLTLVSRVSILIAEYNSDILNESKNLTMIFKVQTVGETLTTEII
jgi:hypothetical protein